MQMQKVADEQRMDRCDRPPGERDGALGRGPGGEDLPAFQTGGGWDALQPDQA